MKGVRAGCGIIMVMELISIVLSWLFDVLKKWWNRRVALGASKIGHSRQGNRLVLYVRLVNESDAPVTVTALQFKTLSAFERKREVLAEVKICERLGVGAAVDIWAPAVALEEDTSFPDRFGLVAVYGAGRVCDLMRLKLKDLRAAREGDVDLPFHVWTSGYVD